MERLSPDEYEALDELVIATGVTQQNILDRCTEMQVVAWLRYAVLGQDYDEVAEFLSEKEGSLVTPSNVKIRIAAAQVNILRSVLRDVDIEEYVRTRPKLKQIVRCLQRRVGKNALD